MKKYQVILADPAWKYRLYDKSDKAHGAAAAHYPTMNLEDIKKLPVPELADKNCALFLWVTPPCLREGLEVIDAWGFRYVTKAFNWVKTYRSGKMVIGLGNYSRANSEDCLLALKGRPKVKSHSVSQIIYEEFNDENIKDITETLITPFTRHSEKPKEQYRRIEELFDGPYLEMFARSRWSLEWDVWGNEVEDSIDLDKLA
jgi:N6-adenosine-specific RNA methylase IME4